MHRFEVHQKQVDEVEAEYQEAENLLRSPVRSVPYSFHGSDKDGGDGRDQFSQRHGDAQP